MKTNINILIGRLKFLKYPIKLLSLLLISTSIMFSACDNGSNTAHLVVRMVDSPGDYDQVLVDVQGIEVHTQDGWVSLENVNTGVYDLLELTNGTEVVLVDTDFPTGAITQMRLILGDDNSAVIDGKPVDLTTPSAQQSGLKFLVNETLLEGITYSFLLDFDAARSVVEAAESGKYILKPVIRVITEATDGAIRGTVVPSDDNMSVYAIIGSDTIGSSFTEIGTGEFLIPGLPDETYTVGIDPGEASGFEIQALAENVQVNIGEVTDIGTVELE